MSSQDERYSILAPLDIELRTKLASAAVEFFNPMAYQRNCEILGQARNPRATEPLAAADFLVYLDRRGILRNADRYLHRIRDLIVQMASTGILVDLSHGPTPNVMIPGRYYCLKELTILQRAGIFWLAPALGPDFLFHLLEPSIVHITGTTKKGDSAAGTGIIFHPHFVLTCRHVVCDMKVDRQQAFQGSECCIVKISKHPQTDVAVLQVDRPLRPVGGLAFLSPVIAQSVFTLGFPKIPCTRVPALTMQPGSVTSESVTIFQGEDLFLYSAIARPGNSGGPIISSEGYIVGISSEDLSCRDDTPRDDAFSPHYAGIPSHEIAKAVDDLGIGVKIPFERYE